MTWNFDELFSHDRSTSYEYLAFTLTSCSFRKFLTEMIVRSYLAIHVGHFLTLINVRREPFRLQHACCHMARACCTWHLILYFVLLLLRLVFCAGREPSLRFWQKALRYAMPASTVRTLLLRYVERLNYSRGFIKLSKMTQYAYWVILTILWILLMCRCRKRPIPMSFSRCYIIPLKWHIFFVNEFVRPFTATQSCWNFT